MLKPNPMEDFLLLFSLVFLMLQLLHLRIEFSAHLWAFRAAQGQSNPVQCPQVFLWPR